MRTGVPETRWKRTWYGLTAQVTLGTRFLHWAGFGGVGMPHPPLANGLLRIGLPEEAKRRLSFAHEFAHFQTAPAALVYMIVLLAAFHTRGRIGVAAILIVLASTHAVWEMLSEGLVVLEDPAGYQALYESISMLGRTLFWVVVAALAAVGWAAVMMPLFE
jgi:hypothetical protein